MCFNPSDEAPTTQISQSIFCKLVLLLSANYLNRCAL